jgi:nucleoside-diphosphate-sugar epimerase
MMKVLVTGGTGFLGRHLATRLVRQGDDVRVLARKTSSIDHLPQGVEIVYGDLKDKASLEMAVKGADVVYHAAAAMRGSWQEYEQSTINGTARMLELSLQTGVKRFVHISSIIVYEVYELGKNAIVDESCPYVRAPEQYGPYTRSKVAAEKLAFDFLKKGLPVVVVRPGLVYGPYSKVLFPHVGYSLGGRLFFIIGRGDNLLPLTYIDNIVDAILLAGAKEGAVGHVYHIVDEVEITQREYLKKYIAATNQKFIVTAVPLSLLFRLAALIEQLRRFGLLNSASLPSKYGLASKWKSLTFDTSKARKQLNWHPRISLEEGLKRTFDWYKGSGQPVQG